MYFSEFEEEDGKLAGNPFSCTLDITSILSDIQDEFLDLKNDSAAKVLYEENSLNVFLVFSASVIQKSVRLRLHYCCPFQHVCVGLVPPPFYNSGVRAGTDWMWTMTRDVHFQRHNLGFITWLKNKQCRPSHS